MRIESKDQFEALQAQAARERGQPQAAGPGVLRHRLSRLRRQEGGRGLCRRDRQTQPRCRRSSSSSNPPAATVSASAGPLVVLQPSGILYTKVKAEAGRGDRRKDPDRRRGHPGPALQGPGERRAHRAVRPRSRSTRTRCGWRCATSAASTRPIILDAIAEGAYSGVAKALFEMTPDEVIDEVATSGQRGRGGAGFDTARKWRSCKAAPGDRRFVLCNGDEGDPGRVHGPLDHGGRSPLGARGHDHRRLRRRRPRGLHLRPRRVPAGGGQPARSPSPRPASAVCSARTSWARASTSTSRSRAAAAPSSAASRRR